FLMAHNEVFRSVDQDILTKLPTPYYRSPSGPPFGAPSRPPVRRIQCAKALWAYNENGSEPNDLSFRAGDIIEVVAETNADWWTGKLNRNQRLIPSNYPVSYPQSGEVRAMSPVSSPTPHNPPAQYVPVYTGPPPQIGYQLYPVQPYDPYTGPPSQPIPPLQPDKSNRFGGLGRVLATSAVGGLGFDAGSALGGDLVQSIF
ncbi:hypothetical protein BGW80DRAFT_1402848, partial [Lactifluus volemus]